MGIPARPAGRGAGRRSRGTSSVASSSFQPTSLARPDPTRKHPPHPSTAPPFSSPLIAPTPGLGGRSHLDRFDGRYALRPVSEARGTFGCGRAAAASPPPLRRGRCVWLASVEQTGAHERRPAGLHAASQFIARRRRCHSFGGGNHRRCSPRPRGSSRGWGSTGGESLPRVSVPTLSIGSCSRLAAGRNDSSGRPALSARHSLWIRGWQKLALSLTPTARRGPRLRAR